MEPDNRQIHRIFNLEVGTPDLWERIILMFCELHHCENEICTVYYKFFWDRLYIYSREYKTNTSVTEPLKMFWTGGIDKPWTN